jgi:hypothetical protein
MTTTMTAGLEGLCARVAQWRQQSGGGRGKRVPEVLWQQAIAVARTLGVAQTARATRLNSERLKARMAQVTESSVRASRATAAKPKASRRGAKGATLAARGPATTNGDGAQFVALQMAPTARGGSITIELCGRNGQRMRIDNATAVDLADVVQAFWGGAS